MGLRGRVPAGGAAGESGCAVAMAKERQKDLSFYEWRFNAWRTSATRDMLDATGRGIYRELLDQCYAQGEFPSDPLYICRVCACSMEQFEAAWKVISKHFLKGRGGTLRNKFADLERRKYADYVEGQRQKRKDAIDKANGNKEIPKVAPTKPDSRINQTRTRTLQGQEQGHDTTKQEASLSVEMTASEPGFWAEQWYARHPKKKDLVLVAPVVCRLFESGGISLMLEIDAAHLAKCGSAKWLEKNGQYVPSLPKWLEDRGWTEPNTDTSPVSGSKFEAAFRVFDTLGGA